MTTTISTETTKAEEFAELLFQQAIASMEMLSVYVGQKLDLYETLDRLSSATAIELADNAGIHRRYAREWLEQQSVAGVLDVEDADAEPYARRYRIPAEHRPVLLDADSTLYLGPLALAMGGVAGVLPELLAAYRSGGGVAYPRYGEDVRHGIAAMNRPVFLDQVSDWIVAMPDVDRRLRETDRPRVLDLGCGVGWSTIAVAQAYPNAQVDGVDLDEDSITEAKANAARSGLTDRIGFRLADASALAGEGGYDLVCIFEALHDMANPVQVLSVVRSMLRNDGAVLIADERVAERFTAPGDEIERLNYGFSVLHCLPATNAESPVVEAGTVLRPDTLRRYAEDAGYASVSELPVDNDLWRFYRLG
ncbi:MAG: methyltransferase domain-containing protein [Propionibacteriales bacterium]|nr:methyltransferase domain-containing protein [Propionibacteriales bacterium]